jgi:uncharacterized protein
MMLDLDHDHLEIVRTILHEFVPQYDVWVFGSRILGTARRFSDLDLVIVTEQPLEFTLLGRIRDAFSESDLPFKVDVLDWSAVSEQFRTIIQEQCQSIQRAAEQSAVGS